MPREPATGVERAERSLHAHEPFFRASFDRDVPGSGLGLAIVHRIATAHGGSLHVESTEGAGTTVVVMLPAWSPRLSG
jgi:two-component system sensor histidine kinase MprB